MALGSVALGLDGGVVRGFSGFVEPLIDGVDGEICLMVGVSKLKFSGICVDNIDWLLVLTFASKLRVVVVVMMVQLLVECLFRRHRTHSTLLPVTTSSRFVVSSKETLAAIHYFIGFV